MKKLLLLLLFVATQSAHALTDREVELHLQKAAQSMRSQLPQRVNGATLITVVAGPGRRIQYTTVSDLAASEWTPSMRAHSKRIAVNDYCSNPTMEAYRSFSVTAAWQLSDREGRHILTNTVGPGDCR